MYRIFFLISISISLLSCNDYQKLLNSTENQSEKSESSTQSVDKKEADPKSPKQDSNPGKNKKSEILST